MGQTVMSFEDWWKCCEKDNMDQVVLSFIIFLSYPGYKKPGK